jgi:hypothetical protein
MTNIGTGCLYGQCYTIFMLLLALVFVTGFSVACITIAKLNTDTICDEIGGNLIRLFTWLEITGIVAFIFGVSSIFFLLLGTITQQFGFMVTCGIVTIVDSLWIIGWTIVGAYQLIKYSADCENDTFQLWIMTIAAIIFMWISLVRCLGLKSCFVKSS